MEAAHSRQGGTGHRAELPWTSIYPELGLEDGGRVLKVPPCDEPDPLQDFHREQASALRKSWGNPGRSPGRDASMPSIEADFGAAP